VTRRNLHSGYQNGVESNIASAFSSPSQFISTVKSQLTNGYEAIKDRLYQITGYHQGSTPGSPSRGTTSGGSRLSRTSSQSSGSGGKAKGYNLRSRPVHSTPRDNDNEPHQRKTTTKHRKQQGEIDEEEEEDDEDDDHHKSPQNFLKKVVHYFKKIFHSPIDIFDTIWDKLKALPWWLLIPLLLFLGLYACK
jgi:hypothetical protein